MQIKFLCPPVPVCEFHGSFSWLHSWDGRSGAAHFSDGLLFICLCAPEFTRLQCCVLWNSSTVLTEHNGALLTAGVPGAVLGNWVQPKASFSAQWGAMLVYCCSGDMDVYVFNHFVCLNILIFNSLANSPHIIQLGCLICVDLQLGQGPDLARRRLFADL